jgi:hypothetical protein
MRETLTCAGHTASSQGLPTSLIVEGAAKVWGLLEDIDAACGGRRVRVLDIGGGLRLLPA